ncbi:MAG: thioredoxin family protein, partial [Pseudomonadota bacterium]
HGCPFVQKHYDESRTNMQGLQASAAEDGIVWLSVISSAPGKQGHVTGAEANDLTETRGASPSSVILDPAGDIGRAYGAKTTPHMYVITSDGTLAYNGAIDSIASANIDDIDAAENYVIAALDSVASGEAADPSTTRPYGCSVKY